MSQPDSWAGSSASAPGLGTTSSSLRGRRRALLRPAVPAGSDLWSSAPAYSRRPALIGSRARFAVFRSPGACPSDLVSHSLVRESDALGASRLGDSLAPPGLPPHEVPGWGCPVASRPAAPTRLPAWSPRVRLAPEAGAGSADRLTIRGRPVARLRSLPLSQTWAGHRPSVQRAENTSNLVNPDGEKSGSLGRGPIKGPIKGSIGSGNPDRFLIPVRRLPPGFEPVE